MPPTDSLQEAAQNLPRGKCSNVNSAEGMYSHANNNMGRNKVVPSHGSNQMKIHTGKNVRTQTVMSYGTGGNNHKHCGRCHAGCVAPSKNGDFNELDAGKNAAGAFRELLLLTHSYNKCGASTVAIDNKIEQAMDLVKSHLMFAVREEVLVLKEQIKELLEKNTQLEYENSVLRNNASPETLSKLSQTTSQGQSQSSQSS